MRFCLSRLGIAIALLALCNSSPLLGHGCVPEPMAAGASLCCEMAVDAAPKDAPTLAPCCCQSAGVPFLLCVAAPLPAHRLQVPIPDGHFEAPAPASSQLFLPLTPKIAPRETDLPPPRPGFNRFRSCRAPPHNWA